MRITLTEDCIGRKSGETFELTNDEKAKGLIAAGMAKAAPAPASNGNDGGLLDEATRSAFLEMGREIAKGITAGAADTKGQRPGIRIDPVEKEFDGLAVFGSHGGFLHAVKSTGVGGGGGDSDSIKKLADWEVMQKQCGLVEGDLVAKGVKAPSGNFENSDTDGGALVIPEFSQKIVERMVKLENFLAETDTIVVRGNTLSIPALDDKSRADGARSGGVLGAYASEADLLGNVSKLKWRTMDLRLKKLYIFAYMTDELLSDSPYAMEQYVAKKAAEELIFKTNDGLFRGLGGGMPLGFLNSPAKIAVTKVSGQAAATILNLNIETMWQKFNAACRPNGVWLINQDTEAQLQQMALPIGIAGVPTYMPVGGVSNPSYATLKGRPVKTVEFAETLGTEGDISLVDWSKYQSIVKGGVKTDMSMHIRFQYGEMAYRFTYRFDSQPSWDAPLTPYKGTNTTSPFVTLATRS